MIGILLTLAGLATCGIALLMIVSLVRSAMYDQTQWKWYRIRIPATITLDDVRQAFDDLLTDARYEWWLIHQEQMTIMALHAHPLVLEDIKKTITSAMPSITFRSMTCGIQATLRWERIVEPLNHQRPHHDHALCIVGYEGKRSMVLGHMDKQSDVTYGPSLPYQSFVKWDIQRILLRYWGHTSTELIPHVLDVGITIPELPLISTTIPPIDGICWNFGCDRNGQAIRLPLRTTLDVLGSDTHKHNAIVQLLRQSSTAAASCVALLNADRADAVITSLGDSGQRLRSIDYRSLGTTTTIDCATWLSNEELLTIIATMADLVPSDPLWLSIAPTIQSWRSDPTANLATLCAELCTPKRGNEQAANQRMTAQRWRTRLAPWFSVRWMGLFATPADNITSLLDCGGIVIVVIPPQPEHARVIKMILAFAVQHWQQQTTRPIITISDMPWTEATIQSGERAQRDAWHCYVGGTTPRTRRLRHWQIDPSSLHTLTGLVLGSPHSLAHCTNPWTSDNSESPFMDAPLSEVFWNCAPDDLFHPSVDLPQTAAGSIVSQPKHTSDELSLINIPAQPERVSVIVPNTMQSADVVPLDGETTRELLRLMLADRRNGLSHKKLAVQRSISREQAQALLTTLHAYYPHIVLKPTYGGMRIHDDLRDEDVWQMLAPSSSAEEISKHDVSPNDADLIPSDSKSSHHSPTIEEVMTL